MPETVEYRARNRPDLAIKIDARDAHLLDLCRWSIHTKPKSLTHYVQGYVDGKLTYLHRLITGAPKGMEVNHLDGDGPNNARANLEITTHAENAAHAVKVLGRGCGPRVLVVKNKVRRRLADGTVRVHIYDRRTGERLESYDETPADLQTASANGGWGCAVDPV